MTPAPLNTLYYNLRSETLLYYLARPGQSVSRLTNTNVETQLADPEIPHHILTLISLRHGATSENRPVRVMTWLQLHSACWTQYDMATQCLRSVVVSRSGVGGHLEPGDVGEVHHLQHLLSLGINLDNILEEKT